MTQELPVGYYPFSKRGFYNYQLNRWYSLGYTRYDEIREAGTRIRSTEDNRDVFRDLAERAEAEGRLQNAAFYYRAAEFLTSPYDPAKRELYQRFSTTFYRAFQADGIERHTVPYGGAVLSAMRLNASGDAPRGTVLIHGGFDSFIEEFYCFWRAFADAGYEVIAFDGPGQGASLLVHEVPSDHDWEKPVGAILDYFAKDEVTLLGISFGGYWCVRAAAFEKRVRRLIVHAPFYDLLERQPRFVRSMVDWLMRHRRFLNASIRMRMKAIPTIRHAVHQVLHVNRALDAEPILAAEWLLQMNKHHIHAELVDQDVLLLAGEKDRFQPPKLLELQRDALVNARSVTTRIFTEAESAQNHCQMGNLGLALEYMISWLDEKTGA